MRGQNAAGVDVSDVTESLLTGDTSDHNSFYGFVVSGTSTRVVLSGNIDRPAPFVRRDLHPPGVAPHFRSAAPMPPAARTAPDASARRSMRHA